MVARDRPAPAPHPNDRCRVTDLLTLLWPFVAGVLTTLAATGRLDGLGRWFEG